MTRLLLASVAAASLALAPPAHAQAGAETHDGFYLHLELGAGGLASSGTADGTKQELSGGGAGLALGLGGAVTPSLIVAGQLWSTSVSSPTVKVNGTKQTVTNSSFGLGGLGLELTYYVMPLNLYVSAVPSIGTLTYKLNGTSTTTKSGFALKLAVGKEWWVSDNWGLGLNVQYAYGSNKDKPEAGVTAATITSGWFGVAFSASYN